MIPSAMLLLSLSGCVTETGNPELDVELRAAATSAQGKVPLAATPSISVTGAWVVIERVELRELTGSTSCESGTEVSHEAEGPFETDLLAATPAAIDIQASTASYCRLRVRLDKADAVTAAPAALVDHSVLIVGERSDGVAFQIRSRDGFEIELRSDGTPFSLGPTSDQLLLAFDLDSWLGGVDLASADISGDGGIYVDEDENRDLLDTFESNVELAMELYADAAGDGALDEDDPLLAD